MKTRTAAFRCNAVMSAYSNQVLQFNQNPFDTKIQEEILKKRTYVKKLIRKYRLDPKMYRKMLTVAEVETLNKKINNDLTKDSH